MRVKKLVSALSALAITVTAMAGLAVNAGAAAGDLITTVSIDDVVDVEKTDTTYYDAASSRMIFSNTADVAKTVTIYLKTPIDITGGTSANDVKISFDMAHVKDTYTIGGNNHRTMALQDVEGNNVMNVVDNYNWGGIYWGNAPDDEGTGELGVSTTSGTACEINVFTSGGKRVAQLKVGNNLSEITEVSGNSISQILLTTGNNLKSTDRYLYIDNLTVAQYEAAQNYKATFTETSGVDANVTVYTDEERQNVVSPAMLESNTTYYYTAVAEGYADYNGTFNVEASNVEVSFEMTKLEQYTATVNAVLADNTQIATYTATQYVGSPIRVFYPAYIYYNGAYYTTTIRQQNVLHYGVDISDETPVNVTYSVADGVVFYGEETDLTLDGKRRKFAKTEVARDRASMGNNGRISDDSYGYTDIISATDTATYTVTLTARNDGRNSGSINLSIRNAETGEITPTGKKITMDAYGPHSASATDVRIPAGYQLVFDNSDNVSNNPLAIDYFTLSNKVVEQPEPEIPEAVDATAVKGDFGSARAFMATYTLNSEYGTPVWKITAEDYGTDSVEANIPATSGEVKLGLIVDNVPDGTEISATFGYKPIDVE